MSVCFTVEEAVLSPNHVSAGKQLLAAGELQADGEGDFGSRQGRRIIRHIENHSSACGRTTGEADMQRVSSSETPVMSVEPPFQESL